MHEGKRVFIEDFVRDFEASRTPGSVMREYELQKKPLEDVFAHTRQCAKSLVALFEAHAPLAGNVVVVQSETGPWILGEDEGEDLALVQKWLPIFVKFFGAPALPPALKKESVEKQVAAHLDARRRLPPLPPKETLMKVQADQRELSGRADRAFAEFHDFLDGYFGKDGAEAFAEKAKYAYDRRAGRYGSKPAKKGRGAEGERAPATPGPVAAGTAGQVAAEGAVAAPVADRVATTGSKEA
jgi:hypothetical protein